MSDAKEVHIEIGKTGADTRVLVDGDEVQGVQGVEIAASKNGGLAEATIHLHPEEVTATIDAGFAEIEW